MTTYRIFLNSNNNIKNINSEFKTTNTTNKTLKNKQQNTKNKKNYFLDFLGGASSLLSRKSISFMRAYLYNETASLSRCNSTSNSVGMSLVSTKYSAKDNTKSPQSLTKQQQKNYVKTKQQLNIKE